jgi:nucleoside-diphosphate-sugar epimerase
MQKRSRFTIFGASGWLGSSLARDLVLRRHEVLSITRENWPARDEQLGHVIYAIGVRSDYQNRPIATARAHVSKLLEVLESFRYDSLLYLSSARIYQGAAHAAEDSALSVNPTDPDDIYGITKLAGEAVCLALTAPTVRVARLSWVVGPHAAGDHFIPALLDECRRLGSVTLRRSADSERDYIALDEVLALCEAIALGGRHRLYNVASGRNVSNRTLAALIGKHLSVPVTFAPDAPRMTFPPIVIDRIRDEFGVTPKSFEAVFSQLIARSAAGEQAR